MRKALITVMAVMLATTVFGQMTPAPAPAAAPQPPQLRFPAPSPHASLSQTIGIVDMNITYSRPGVKGRQGKIWGGLVPYDQVWRTGANEATRISFSDDVTINGQPLPKGTYSLHTLPGKDSWTIIFNSVADQWGSYSYDKAKDTLRVSAKQETAPFTEWMTFDVPQMSTDKATVMIRWENLAVPFTVDTASTQKALAAAGAAASAAAASDWRTPYRAANYAFTVDPNSAEAQKWVDQSLKAGENMTNLWLKARMLQKRGQIADALRTGEMALSKATDKDAEMAGEIRTEMATWRK